MTESTFKACVLHQGLGLKFKIKIDPATFTKLRADTHVECFEKKVVRKFFRSFLTLTDLE
jgi:hypothetical protein